MAATTATVVQPDTSPYPVNGEQLGGIGGFVLTALGVILWLRRKLPKDTLAAHKDRTEGLMLNEARAERDKALADARDAWSQLNAMQYKQGALSAEVDYLKRELDAARELVSEIRRGVQQVGQKVDVAESNLKTVEKRNGNSGPAPL